MKIPFNIPYITGNEIAYINEAISRGHLSGNGPYTLKCQNYFEQRWGFKKALLTTSCTDALEMAALLIDIEQGDEVIVPAYTYVSTALAFARQGARIVFIDSRNDHPGMNEDMLEDLITSKTKAIVAVHYAGIACDMDKIMKIAEEHSLYVIEDAAYGINSYYREKPLGGMGQFGCFSFHETKPIHCGEGGMLVINDARFIERAEIIWEKGTNRASFARKEVQKYEWIDTGSSFLPSDINAAFLYAQLEELDAIQAARIAIREQYVAGLSDINAEGSITILPRPDYATENGNMLYFICNSGTDRNGLIRYLKERGIMALFHYLPLHKSPWYKKNSDIAVTLPRSESYAERLVRFPLYPELKEDTVSMIIDETERFFKR